MKQQCDFVVTRLPDGRFFHRCGRTECRHHRVSASEVVYKTCGDQTLGPGGELRAIFDVLGVRPKKSCKCAEKARQMDAWGVEGCRENRDTIIGWMREAYSELTKQQKIAAGALALKTGLAFKVNPLDPIPSLVDLAIARASL